MQSHRDWLLAQHGSVCAYCGTETPDQTITLDDAPRNDTAHFDGATRTTRLLAVLEAARVEQIAFFCNSVRMDAAGAARIKKYAQAGHLIANHTHTHGDLHRMGVESFLADFATADAALRGLTNFRPWMRFPYLNEGKTVEEDIDKVTGQKRLVVKDSDEKNQPRLEIKDGNKTKPVVAPSSVQPNGRTGSPVIS